MDQIRKQVNLCKFSVIMYIERRQNLQIESSYRKNNDWPLAIYSIKTNVSCSLNKVLQSSQAFKFSSIACSKTLMFLLVTRLTGRHFDDGNEIK